MNIIHQPGVPETFKIQDGCHNCEHHFLWYDYDCGDLHFCTKLSPRPKLCNSVALGEPCYTNEMTEKEQDAAYEEWICWSDKHQVYGPGICDDYKKKDDEK